MDLQRILLLTDDDTVASPHGLQGQLRVLSNGTPADARGPRRGLFTSDFPALGMMETDAQTVFTGNRLMAQAGWHGPRGFVRLADDFGRPPVPTTFWGERFVSHAMAMKHIPSYLDNLRSLGLKFGCTKGVQYSSDQEETDQTGELCDLIVREGHQATIAWWEILGNEPFQNHKYGRMGFTRLWPEYPDEHGNPTSHTDYSAAVNYAQHLAQLVKSKVGCLTSMGSFEEDGVVLKQIATGVDLVDVHGARDMPNGVKHAHTVFDFCRYQRNIPGKGILQGENGGLNDPFPFTPNVPRTCGDLSTAVNDHDYIFTLTAIQQLTAQLSVQLTGPHIRHWCRLDSCWSFHELPALLAPIPHDIGLWEGRSFFTKGSEFVWAGLTEWQQMQNPPFQVRDWRAFAANQMTSGSGLA